MSSFNRVILMGNLTRDPEVRYSPNGTAVAKIGIAVTEKWKGQDGQAKESTTFVDVDAFGKTAELVGKFFDKGKPIMLEGRLKLDEWEDKQTGQKRSRLGVVMDKAVFLPSGSKRGQEGGNSTQPPKASQQASSQPDLPTENEDDVPF